MKEQEPVSTALDRFNSMSRILYTHTRGRFPRGYSVEEAESKLTNLATSILLAPAEERALVGQSIAALESSVKESDNTLFLGFQKEFEKADLRLFKNRGVPKPRFTEK